LAKLCQFKHENPIVLTLSKIGSTNDREECQ